MHVGIIMDGNGRWAKKKGKARVFGHNEGLSVFRNVIKFAAQHEEISQMTAFALSHDNLKRSKMEITAIVALLKKVVQHESAWFVNHGVSVNFIGDLSFFSNDLQILMREFTSLTQGGQALRLNVALNYSGKHDILQTIKQNPDCSIQELDNCFAVKNIDLIIRTSGEQRLSDFCLWQSAYSELFFSDKLWPDFTIADFIAALSWFRSRNRRYGEVCE